jgi:O-antigen ligase
MTLLAVLRYHDIVEIKRPEPPPSFDPRDAGRKQATDDAFVKETVWDPVTRQEIEIKRLRGTGIFQDPNDICLALCIAIPLTLFWLTDPRMGAARVLWVGPLFLFCWALYHTHSRGGLMGFMAGMLALFNARYGWRKTLALMLPALPVFLVLFAGRMTSVDLDSSKSTGQSRIQMWSSAFDELRAAPLLGIGMGEQSADMSHLAHNSFIQCFMDLGIVGGTLFLGAFYCALAALRRVGSGKVPVVSLEVWRIRPYLVAIVVGAAVCMLSLTLSYLVPTYMILGLVTAYVAVAIGRSPRPVLSCDLTLLRRMGTISVLFLVVAYAFVRVMVRWG